MVSKQNAQTAFHHLFVSLPLNPSYCMRAVSLTALTAIFIFSCSVLKKDDPEKEVRDFLTSFQQNLQKSDEEILKQFEGKQSDYVILEIIKILQNKESSLITSEANFSAAVVTIAEEGVKAEIPVTLKFDESKGEDGGQAMLTFWLKAKEKSFVISKVEGEILYQEFTSLKNRNEWVIAEKAELDKRAAIFASAQSLEQNYDSVIWYTSVDSATYFYVVQGDWTNYFLTYDTRNQVPSGVKMGLVDNEGSIVIPIEYDLVGTIGFDQPDLVEVRKDGKVGYFDLAARKIVVEPVYDMIIPYGSDNVKAIVKTDSAYGWVNDEYVYAAGFPSTSVQHWITTFEYLKKPVSLKVGNQNLCEVPNTGNIGNGIVMPPSYFVAHGLFNTIESGISTTSIPINGWTEYKETKGTVFERLTENINAVITTVRERYLEGREEFYTKNKLVFVDAKQDTINVSEIEGESLAISSVDSSLLEIRTPQSYWFEENNLSVESNLTQYNYFRIGGEGLIEKLSSNRLFPQTEFVKLDSSYIMGEFVVYNSETEQNDTNSVLSVKTLTSMRNEILASYGYSFPSEPELEQLKLYSWYKPEYDTMEELSTAMTDIDKHNIAFLEKMIRRLSSNIAMID
jgi:hypothetical protein